MTKIALIVGGQLDKISGEFDRYVAVDRACLFLIKEKLPLDIAVGDFDSVNEHEKEIIFSCAERLVTSQAEKNDTDTEMAIKMIFEQYPNAYVTVFGALGGRLDHSLSNIFLPSDPEIAPFMKQIKLIDSQNLVTYYPAGQHAISASQAYRYISFLPSENDTFEILGAKYPLTASNFFQKKIYVSNEFISGNPIAVSVKTGYLIVIMSKDKSE